MELNVCLAWSVRVFRVSSQFQFQKAPRSVLEAWRCAESHNLRIISEHFAKLRGVGPFLYIHDTQYKARHQCASPWAKQHSKTTSIQGYHNGMSNSQAMSTNVGPWMGRWYAEGWISSKLRSPLGSTPRPAMKRSGTNKSSLLWYLAAYDVFSWNLAVPNICLICVISYHDTWHDILLSLTSSLHIFASYPCDSGHINKVFPETCWSARTPGWSGRGFWSNPWGPLGQSIKQRLSSPLGWLKKADIATIGMSFPWNLLLSST